MDDLIKALDMMFQIEDLLNAHGGWDETNPLSDIRKCHILILEQYMDYLDKTYPDEMDEFMSWDE